MHFTAALLISECGVKAKANSGREVTKGGRADGGMTKGGREVGEGERCVAMHVVGKQNATAQ